MPNKKPEDDGYKSDGLIRIEPELNEWKKQTNVENTNAHKKLSQWDKQNKHIALLSRDYIVLD